MFDFNAETIFDFLFCSVVLVFILHKWLKITFNNIEKNMNDKPDYYTEYYYLFTNNEGEEYLVPTNLDYEKQLSPEQTKWLCENYDYDVMDGLGDLTQVWVYKETQVIPLEKRLKILRIFKIAVPSIIYTAIIAFLFHSYFMITP